MKVSFIIQARVGSSRLPNKILLPFYEDKCILELLIEKLKNVEHTDIIVATADTADNDVLERFCIERDIKCFRGSENDVLQRFIGAAEYFGAKRIIRVCSDNPFIELDSIKRLVNKSVTSEADYISFDIDGQPSIKTHFGFWTEYATLEALKQVAALTDDSLYHEHVTNYIYSHPEEFRIEWITGPECLNSRRDIRLTCDTIEDFNSCADIYRKLCKDNPYPTIGDIVDYIDSHDDYLGKMKEQIKCNSK